MKVKSIYVCEICNTKHTAKTRAENCKPNVQAHPRRELKPEFKKDVTRRWMERLVRFSSFVGRCVLMGIVTLIFVLLVSGIAGIAIGLLEAVLGIP